LSRRRLVRNGALVLVMVVGPVAVHDLGGRAVSGLVDPRRGRAADVARVIEPPPQDY
jgi:hypothetical protein